MNTQTLTGKQYAEWLLAQVTAEQLLTQAAYGLAMSEAEFEAFAAAELQDLQEGMREQEREPLA